MTSLFASWARGATACGTAFRSPIVPSYDALQFANVRTSLHALLDDSGVTNIALIAKRAAEVRQIVHNAIGNDALLQQTLSDCLSRSR